MALKSKLVKLAYENPGEIRDAVLPLIKEAGGDSLSVAIDAAMDGFLRHAVVAIKKGAPELVKRRSPRETSGGWGIAGKFRSDGGDVHHWSLDLELKNSQKTVVCVIEKEKNGIEKSHKIMCGDNYSLKAFAEEAASHLVKMHREQL